MTLQLELTPDMETKLRDRAAVEGKDPATLVIEAVAEKLAAPNGPRPEATASGRLDAWNQFIAGTREHDKGLPSDHIVDDSRDSIYEGRGE